MEKLSVVIIDGSELFAQGIQNQLVQNKIAPLSNIFISTHSSQVDLPSNIDLIIVGQACLDNIQFEDILKNLKSLKQESHVLLIPEIINSKTAKGLFSNKLVDGIISRNCSLNDFRIAIETLTKGDVYIGPDISLHQSNEMTVQVTKKDNPYYLLQKLTIQEKKIMELVIEGKSSTDIAQLLFRSVHTIKTHRKNMLHKLGVSNTIELISFLDSVDYYK